MKRLSISKALDLTVESRQLMRDHHLETGKPLTRRIAKYMVESNHGLTHTGYSCFLCEAVDRYTDCGDCPIYVVTGVQCVEHDDNYHVYDLEGGIEFILAIQAEYRKLRKKAK
jgi:hypothetical protein